MCQHYRRGSLSVRRRAEDGLVPVKVPVDEVVTDELTDAIYASFDAAKIAVLAKA